MNGQEAEQFLFAEARLLDENQLQAWLALAAEDFRYWIPVNTDQIDPELHLSIVYETKKQCADRIFRVSESGMHHTQDPPSRTTRFVTNVEVFPGTSDDEVVLGCNTLLFEVRAAGQRRNAQPTALPARCQYRLRRDNGIWRMTFKKVLFVNVDGPLDTLTHYF